jgi:hypothetical protein
MLKLMSAKIRLNQNSNWQIECYVDDSPNPVWRDAIAIYCPAREERVFRPDVDDEKEEIQEDIRGNFYITKKV